LFSLAVQGVQDEGKHAIDSPGKAINADMPPEEYALGKNFYISPIF
jgi:hypothetical protein